MESQTGSETRVTYLDTRAAGELLGLSARTLEGMRVRGGGPPYRRHGGRVRYGVADLIAWSDATRRTSTSGTGSPGDE